MVGRKAVDRVRSRFLSVSPDLIRAKSSLQRVGTNAGFCLHQELASLVSKGGPGFLQGKRFKEWEQRGVSREEMSPSLVSIPGWRHPLSCIRLLGSMANRAWLACPGFLVKRQQLP